MGILGCALAITIALVTAACLHSGGGGDVVRPTTPSGVWQSHPIPAFGVMAGEVRTTEGRPVGGASVRTEPLDDSAFIYPVGVRTDSDGLFTNTAIAAPGRYEITVTAEGYRPATETAIVERKRFTLVEFELERAH